MDQGPLNWTPKWLSLLPLIDLSPFLGSMLGLHIFVIIFLFLQFCCVAGYHNLIILRGDRAIYPEKGLLATNYQGKTIFLLTLQQRDKSRDKILISKYCISYLSAYCTEMYRGRAACYWLDI